MLKLHVVMRYIDDSNGYLKNMVPVVAYVSHQQAIEHVNLAHEWANNHRHVLENAAESLSENSVGSEFDPELTEYELEDYSSISYTVYEVDLRPSI